MFLGASCASLCCASLRKQIPSSSIPFCYLLCHVLFLYSEFSGGLQQCRYSLLGNLLVAVLHLHDKVLVVGRLEGWLL